MGKDSNIVHQYFRLAGAGHTILVKVNPILYKGTEIIISPNEEIKMRDLEFDEQIFDDLKADGFEETSALVFNLYLSGLA